MNEDLNSRLNEVCNRLSSLRGEQSSATLSRLPNIKLLNPRLADVWTELVIAGALLREYERREIQRCQELRLRG